MNDYNGVYEHVNNTWIVTFGVADGNVPQLGIVDTSTVERSIVGLTSVSQRTVQEGVACEVQEICLHGADEGSFTLSFDGYSSESIAFDASAQDFRKAIVGVGNSGFKSLDDVHVTRVRDTETRAVG